MFHQTITSRNLSLPPQYTESYRYGFQGQEGDDEVAGEGNSYNADFWQYDSRLGRRWNIDPVVKYHESPYAAFANNPIIFVDPNGADTLSAVEMDLITTALNEYTKEINRLGELINLYATTLAEMEGLADEHTAWETGISFLPGGIGIPGAAAMQIDWEVADLDEILEQRYAELYSLMDEFDALVTLYNSTSGYLQQRLENADAIEFEGGIFASSLAILAVTHKNGLGVKGNFALYEITLNGEHYKFGIADADRVTQSDISVKDWKGTVKGVIPKGTPIRIYQQQRAALIQNYAITVSYEVHNGIYKFQIRAKENTAIVDKYNKTGYIGDGNIAHAKSLRAKQKGIYPSSLKKK